MKPKHIQDPFRNPFHNRFHVSVHSRLDEMQSNTHMVWLNERNSFRHQTDNDPEAHHWGRALVGAFALVLVVVFSAAILSN